MEKGEHASTDPIRSGYHIVVFMHLTCNPLLHYFTHNGKPAIRFTGVISS